MINRASFLQRGGNSTPVNSFQSRNPHLNPASMQLLVPSPPLRPPSLLLLTRSCSPTRNPISFPPQKTLTSWSLFLSPSRRRRRPPRALPLTDEDLLNALVGSSDAADDSKTHFPAVRSYESDLASLVLVGAVSPEQALTAAAADGGATADEHISSGTPTMVVETVFPGALDEHSTVSTRLFLPAKKVKEKAKKMRSSLTADILSSNATVSRNILAMTFRQVVMHRLWSFKLSLFSPGAERNMDDLASPRKVLTDFTVSSSDGKFLSALAEVVFSCALKITTKNHGGNSSGTSLYSVFDWFQKPQRISSADSSVCLYQISAREIVKNARSRVEKFHLAKGEMTNRKWRVKHRWWAPPDYPGLDRAGGPGFSAWTNEFVPAYRLQIDADMYKDTNLEGWKKLDDNRWEVLLTHFQMVELANILDMYYDDLYTIPGKQISCGLITETSNMSRNKHFSWKMVFVTLAGGCILILTIVLSQICGPHLLRPRKDSKQSNFLLSSETDCCLLQSPEATKLEALCISIVKQIKDELGWPGDIMVDTNVGAWSGTLPTYLRSKDSTLGNVAVNGNSITNCDSGDARTYEELFVDAASPMEKNNIDMETNAQNIASYQVVMSRDGKIIGFQPTSRLAVNHWASNPLAKVLYEGRKLSPGLLEPSLKIPHPREAVLIELLMSVNPESSFALARQFTDHRKSIG